MKYDLLIHSGRVFDGMGSPSDHVDVGIREGTVVEIGSALSRESARQCINASGHWVIPGMIDNHTHYDAELLMAPGLPESLRHGVTTVCLGSCSLSTIFSNTEQCADLFARVEAIPHRFVCRALQDKHWNTPGQYAKHLETLALGPNIVAFIGHSDLRSATMGLDAATQTQVRPTRAQMQTMLDALEEALNEGFLGISCMTNPWDKLGGTTELRSRALPSTYAKWKELKALHRILRQRGAILQSAPNITTKYNGLLYAWESCSFGFRKPLKTTLITVADTKANPLLSSSVLLLSSIVNRCLGGDLRWQSLPMPFEVYADGIDLVIFEEFGAGEQALHLAEQAARNELFADPQYRRAFRKDYDRRFSPRVWHRNFDDAQIVAAPEQGLAGKSFGELARARNEHPVDTFLDLVMAHGDRLRWRTTIANHRPNKLATIVKHPSVQIGFSDAGAHLRNMGFYNFPLHLLRWATPHSPLGRPVLSPERAVHRATGEIASWLGIDAGTLRVGDRADIAIVNPQALDQRLDAYHEAPIDVFDGLMRQVRRNDTAIHSTIVGGEVLFQREEFSPSLGVRAHGRFLRRGQKSAERSSSSDRYKSVGQLGHP